MALFGSLEPFEKDHRGDDHAEHEPPVTGKQMADADQHLGQHRQRHVHPLENGQEFRQHVGHEKEHDPDADHADKSRIDQRGGKLRLHLGKLLEMVGHAPQHFDQRTAGFAGAHHVDVQIGEDARLLGHGVRQAPALHHILPQVLADVRGNTFRLEVRHAVERHGQRHAGTEQVGQLLRESAQFLHLRLALLGERDPHAGRQEPAPIGLAAQRAVG